MSLRIPEDRPSRHGRLLLLLSDIPLDLLLKDGEGEGAGADDHVVKITDVVGLAEGRPGPGPQFQDLDHAHLVAQRLARIDKVALHFGDDIALVDRRILGEILDRLNEELRDLVLGS